MKTLTLIIFCLSIILPALSHAEKLRLHQVPEQAESPRERKPKTDGELTPEERKRRVSAVVDEFYQKGLRAYRAGSFEQAEGFFDRVLILDPNHAGARAAIKQIMAKWEDSRPAPPPQQKAEDKLKTLEDAMAGSFKQGHLERANQQASEILSKDPNNQAAVQMLKDIRRDRFARALEKAKEREKSSDIEGAINAYQAALAFHDDPKVVQKMETLKQRLSGSKLEQSNQLYLQALDASQNGNFGDAMQLCKRALAFNPDNLQAQRMMERLKAKAPPQNP